MKLQKLDIDKRLVKRALMEDAARNDVTTLSAIPAGARASATLIAKEDMSLAGIEVFMAVFEALDPAARFTSRYEDGAKIKKGAAIINVRGRARAILSCERVALNFLQHMCGIATLTAKFVKAAKGSQTKILDTRKTTPGLRDLEKYSVLCGGGFNHRRDLKEMAVIKENHIAGAGGIAEAVRRVRKKLGTEGVIEVEARNIKEVKEALETGVERIMFDNMTPAQVKKGVALIDGKIETEASGNMNIGKIGAYAKTGVDFISVGAITHSAPSVDISLLFE
ncbi:Quinolinate phosphoribosyltransferase [decarboxylating] [hydrothermal vent metagenome]|uniref:Probable nicotinate-nucleotide pyrophosphorylase [carboxylating] n=1 Tax=hydrothermal vent metagenome TaxID=652676 RepID=A0A3B1CM14_9ZZZZ